MAAVIAQENRAVRLDGYDSNLCIGMDTINNCWSVEAWVKGDDDSWKEQEVIIGGGEYSELNITDKRPVVLKNGRLYNTHSKAIAQEPLTPGWHHIAITSGYKKGTTLYVDGKMVAQSDLISSIIPGVIGADEGKESVFGGDIDEVRIWKTELSSNDIKRWMKKSITPKHPHFESLKGYYTFDEPTNDMYVNWVANGHLSFHARNGRIDYAGSNKIIKTVENDNDKFVTYNKTKTLFNAVELASEWDSPQGSKDQQLLKLRIAVNGDDGELKLTNIKLNFSATTSLDDIKGATLYYSGATPKSGIKEKLLDFTPENLNNIDLDFDLQSGINYFLVAIDVKEDAKCSNILSASIDSFELGKNRYTPLKSEYYPKVVVPNSNQGSIISVLSWNIWHGGRHLGVDGPGHIIDLIEAINPDVITMQEAYGSQNRIAEATGMYLQTASEKDNLALFSRLAIEAIPTKNPFKSNPVILTTTLGEKIYVNGCWLRYAYRPEYTCYYGSQGLDTDVWIKEDNALPVEDVTSIINDDMLPYVNGIKAQIVSGDFNSCSHLDWTDRTSELHYGYGAVAFPTSKFMYGNGFEDSFRVVNPNELTHQGGTYAVIFGQLQTSRIDFTYHKGDIKPIYSKIVRTAEEIDFVWAGDHAAVYTIFKIL